MKILHVITRLISGGADENTLFTIEGADTERYTIDLLVGAGSEKRILDTVTKAHVITMPELMRNIHPFKDLIAFFNMIRLIRKNKYDIVHTHTAKAGILGRFAAKCSGTRIVVHSLHGATFHETQHPFVRLFYKQLEKWAAHCTDHFITVGDDLRDRYLAAGVGKPQQYTTIRSGFDLQHFLIQDQDIVKKSNLIRKELGISQKSFILGNISRLEPRKGHIYLLKSCQELLRNSKELYLICAGEGYYHSEIQRMINDMGISDKVFLLGFRKDITDVMSAMDVVLLTSLWEGLPRVLVQAAALAKPIITFAVEGATELVTQGHNGYIAPLKDVEALTQYVTELVQNPRQARIMGKSSRNQVLLDWDWREMVKRIYALYEKLDAG